MLNLLLTLPALVLFSAPGAADSGLCSARPNDTVSDLKSAVGQLPPPPVYYGTRTPRHVALTEGQLMAIGSWDTCSGTLISDQWVLTADHCELTVGREFCVGSDPSDPDQCFTAVQVEDNPYADMTLVRLDRKVTEVMPEVEPIPLFTDDLDSDWIGVTAEAAGYGQQENGGYGEREFTAEPIVSLRGHIMTIDGEGKHGVCFGDSGGPVMVTDSGGNTRVAGTLSNGDNSCTGRDNYTRVDTNRDWIEGIMGPIADTIPQDDPVVDDEPEIDDPVIDDQPVDVDVDVDDGWDDSSEADTDTDASSSGGWSSFWSWLFGR